MNAEQRAILSHHSPQGWTPGTEAAIDEIIAAERAEAIQRAQAILRDYAREAETTGRNPVAARAIRAVAERIPHADLTAVC